MEICDTGRKVGGAPECTLRAAIVEANTNGLEDVIRFRIRGDPEITLDEPLPALEGRITIDGSSQPRVALRAGRGRQEVGLRLAGNGNRVQGLAVSGFVTGIEVASGVGNAVVASTIGLVDGRPDDRTTIGVDITGGSGAAVGGTTTPGSCNGDCNRIWGRLHGVSVGPRAARTVITGNAIADGGESLQQSGSAAISVLADTVIGGDTAALGNDLRGLRGIEVAGGKVRISGNTIRVAEVGITVAPEVEGVVIGARLAPAPGAAPGNHVVTAVTRPERRWAHRDDRGQPCRSHRDGTPNIGIRVTGRLAPSPPIA